MFWEGFAIASLLTAAGGIAQFLRIFKHKEFNVHNHGVQVAPKQSPSSSPSSSPSRAGEVQVDAKPHIYLGSSAENQNLSPEKTMATKDTSEDVKKLRELKNG